MHQLVVARELSAGGGTSWTQWVQSLDITQNASKTWLVVKPEHLKEAELHFQGTDVMITTRGQRHLGHALGDRTFVREFVVEKVTGWVKEMEKLSTIAKVKPQAAHIVYIHGLMHR